LWAARALGVGLVLSWNGVGAINPVLRVGEAVVPAAVMDWTRHRVSHFGSGEEAEKAAALRSAAHTINHIHNGRDPKLVARPFNENARQAIYSVLRITYSESDHPQYAIRNTHYPVYVCTEGPRLETAAEIELAAELGADVVGMTLCPEVWLAAELGLGYASLCLVTNFATGRKHLDPRRNFGPAVAERGMRVLLAVAEELNTDGTDGTD
jgi:5'-methylthioadenosine phosphorylase